MTASLDHEANDGLPEKDEPAPPPPTVERVRRRAWVLCAVACRAYLETFEDKMDSATLHSRVLTWCEEMDLRSEMEPKEIELLDTDIGDLKEQDLIDGSWRSEGLVMLAWALGRYELPAHDQMADPYQAAESVFFLETAAREMSAELQLRSAKEIDDMASRILAIHWRVRDYYWKPEPLDFVDFARRAWFGPLSIEGVPTVDRDLAIDEVAISQASEERFHQVQSIAMERHQAINWLRGWNAVYSQVDTST